MTVSGAPGDPRIGLRCMGRDEIRSLGLVGPLVLSGASALVLQVVWQRVISLEFGVDLASSTVVVTAFLAGYGAGGFAGGAIADRLGPSGSRRALSAVNVALALTAWLSVPIAAGAVRVFADQRNSATEFAGLFLLLVAPTSLQGTVVPLALRAGARSLDSAPSFAARLVGWNTLGAVVGTLAAGWVLVGSLGYQNTASLAACANLLAALIVGIGAARGAGADRTAARVAAESPAQTTSPRPWYVLYAIVGAVALGFEQVFFRLVDAVMRSNSYSFGHVLSLYLVAWATGVGLGSRLVRRVRAPEVWFFGLMIGVALSATGALVGLVRVLPAVGARHVLTSWFEGNGYTTGFEGITEPKPGVLFIIFTFVVPAGLMALPVGLSGAILPFAQRLVSDTFDTVGRRFGALNLSNAIGAISGGILVSFVVLDVLGTAITHTLLSAVTGCIGLGGLVLSTTRSGTERPPSRAPIVTCSAILLVVLLVAAPSNHQLWAFLHASEPDGILVEEDRSCASAVRLRDRFAGLTINGSTQNDYPFDDFHVLIGLLPVVAHKEPKRGLAVGLGIGSTTYGMLLDPRIDQVDTVELCGGNERIVRRLANDDRPELAFVAGDVRSRIHNGDGREYLRRSTDPFDVITVDTMRPQTANSGSFYSVEFYELVASRLSEQGIFTSWMPTERALNGISQVFPYSIVLRFEDYFGSVFVLASRSPIHFDSRAIADEVRALDASTLDPGQRRSLIEFVASARPACLTNGTTMPPVDDGNVNRDLRPRDEYFLNNPPATISSITPAC